MYVLQVVEGFWLVRKNIVYLWASQIWKVCFPSKWPIILSMKIPQLTHFISWFCNVSLQHRILSGLWYLNFHFTRYLQSNSYQKTVLSHKFFFLQNCLLNGRHISYLITWPSFSLLDQSANRKSVSPHLLWINSRTLFQTFFLFPFQLAFPYTLK